MEGFQSALQNFRALCSTKNKKVLRALCLLQNWLLFSEAIKRPGFPQTHWPLPPPLNSAPEASEHQASISISPGDNPLSTQSLNTLPGTSDVRSKEGISPPPCPGLQAGAFNEEERGHGLICTFKVLADYWNLYEPTLNPRVDRIKEEKIDKKVLMLYEEISPILAQFSCGMNIAPSVN